VSGRRGGRPRSRGVDDDLPGPPVRLIGQREGDRLVEGVACRWIVRRDRIGGLVGEYSQAA
jgi:hypothetical protein